MKKTLDKQRNNVLIDTIPSLKTRIDRLDRLIEMLLEFQGQIPEVLSNDFGHRSPVMSKFSDVAAVFDSIHYTKKNLKKWMKPESRNASFPFNILLAKAYVQYQPVGCVGIISPWNYPFSLTYAPLAVILAAGNRAMIKPSEYTPQSSLLMKTMIEKYFDEDEVAVFPGGPEVGEEFTSLPFDHLLFTGSTSVARKVMEAASKNLVPVTLELGGKSPVIVGDTADMTVVSDRVWNGKLMNCGQTCIAPDYLFIPERKMEEWIEASQTSISTMYPSIYSNDDYSSIINDKHFSRLQSYLDDAKDKGARIIEINPAKESNEKRNHHKMMPTIVLGATDEMLVMKEEIFGPILPVKTYRKVDEAIDYINNKDRPLGMYYFGNDTSEESNVINKTVSGGVCLNDVIFHYVQEDLPFGGIGPSGMGRYHGIEGFKTFSNPRGIYKQTPFNAILKLMRPPYGKLFDGLISSRIKK
jgi:coniferyl-aldehyde dehydrogenase|tara:strand:+ start:1500 stop:2906 length:1407 start_codon:yes stop_codon:yes gene_type:complete